MNKKILFLTLAMTTGLLQAAPLGFLEPYNFMIASEPSTQKAKLQWNFLAQRSYDVQSFDEEGDIVNALQVYDAQQDMLGLFQGFGNSSDFNQLVNQLAGGSGGGVNNGQNGLFTPAGVFSGEQYAFYGSYRFHHNCYFKFSLPVYNIALSNVTWTYTGNNDTFAGQAIESKLVESFMNDAQNLFGLSLGDWKRSGLGDIACLLDYIGDYPQGRPLLRNVRVLCRLGLTFPTGEVVDENVVMSMPFGCDGSVSMPFGLGLDVNLGRYFQCGWRGQFRYIWGNEKLRRVPTFATQTTLLFPSVMETQKNFGVTQTFDLYMQLYNLFGGLSFKVAYEHFKKSQDSVAVRMPGFNYELLNTDRSLEEVTTHNVICLLSFDSAFLKKYDKIHPQFGVYVNIPFNGSFATLASTVGAQLSLDF